MAIIKYYLDPAGAAQVDNAATVAESLLRRWPGGHGVPQGLRIYRGDVCGDNDITDDALARPQLLMLPSDGEYNIVVTPGNPYVVQIVIAVVVAVAAVLLTPTPKVPPNANRNQQSPNNFLSSRSNQPRVNQRSTDIRGKQPNAYPDLLMVPYRRFRNSVEFEYIYAQVSEGYVQTSQWKDGATRFERITGARLAVYGPDTSPLSGTPDLVVGGSAPDELIYDVTQSNEVDGALLPAPNADSISESIITIAANGDISTDSLTIDFTQFMSIGSNVTLSGCYIFAPDPDEVGAYNIVSVNGTYVVNTVTTNTFNITITPEVNGVLLDTGSQPFRRLVYQDNTNTNLWYLTDPGGGIAYPVTFTPKINGLGSAGSIGPFDASGYDKILVNIVARNGLYKDDGTDAYPTSVSSNVYIYELDEFGIRTGNSTTTGVPIFSNPSDVRQSTGASLEVVVPYEFAEVSAERVTPTDKDFEGTVVDEIQWRDLYLLIDVPTIDTSYATTVHAEIRGNADALRVKDRKLNCTAERLIAPYVDGSFGLTEDTASDLFADVIASIWRDPLFGRGDDDEVNWEQLYDMQADMITYFGETDPCRVGYTFDSDKITAEDAIKLICNAVNVIPYRIGSVLNFWFEGPQSQSAMQFGHRFKHPGTDQRSRSFGPSNDNDGVELTYFDEITGAFEIVTRGGTVNPLKIELSGCITARGAQIRVDREWNKLQYSRVQHGFDATAIGRMVVPGMRVDVVDNTRYAPYNGEVRAINGVSLTISQPVTLATPTDYSMVLTRRDGSLEAISVAAQPAPDIITLASAPTEAPQVSRDADRTSYSLATDDMRTALAMLVREVNYKDYNRIGIACINYDDRYYQGDIV